MVRRQARDASDLKGNGDVEPELILPLVMRWLHILSAVVVAGGTLFLVLVVQPGIKRHAPEEARAALEGFILTRWKMVFHPLILVFLITGFYNYLFVTRFLHEGQGVYHALFGVKFLLALVVFVLGIAATSKMAWSERLRTGRGLWALLVASLVAVVLVGGVMKTLPTTGAASSPVESTESTVGPE